MSISRRLRPVNERVSAVGAAIFGGEAVRGRGAQPPGGDGRPALAGREGSRRGGHPPPFGVRGHAHRAQPLVKNKVYKYWFKSRLKRQVSGGRKTGGNPCKCWIFCLWTAPSNVNRCAPHLSALCPSSVKDRAPHLSVVAPPQVSIPQGTYPQACPHHLWETRVKSGVFADLRGWPAPRRRPKSSLPLICQRRAG